MMAIDARELLLVNVLCNVINCKHNNFSKTKPALCKLKYITIQASGDAGPICANFKLEGE